LLYLTASIPDSGSAAVSVKVTEVEVVYASPWFINIEPVGGVASSAALTSATSASENIAKNNSINKAKAALEVIFLFILRHLSRNRVMSC